MSFHPDGQTLVTAHNAAIVQFWHVPLGRLLKSVSTDGCTFARISQDGKRFVLTSG